MILPTRLIGETFKRITRSGRAPTKEDRLSAAIRYQMATGHEGTKRLEVFMCRPQDNDDGAEPLETQPNNEIPDECPPTERAPATSLDVTAYAALVS